ncbi:hypothetical protein Lbir_0950 [Legionella birminghamensis]|uniref:Uncharacterized protein n=1 Tax=Legionella birminghamensis TaxID=28083 RepID=A0A378I6H9_9GAMM|nr:OTU domain-containing protein [Legionella birminghamensis]KTC73894.1 hypothetical protein Lbir_0950 [Legionella birminghamensis]STX30462.1 Uncharacterised protein [Legionella birminghamensis]
MATATSTSTFFRQAPGINQLVRPAPQSAEKQLGGYINVGDGNDCFFRSVAAGIISKVLKDPIKNERLIKQILDYHKEIFPKPQQHERAPSYAARLKLLMAAQPITQFVRDLGFTLRQIAVDEIISNLIVYQDAFTDDMESVDMMRKGDTWINDTVLRDALAYRLALPIDIHEIEHGKPLHASHHSLPPAGVIPASKIKIQLLGKHYMPSVTNITVFEKLNAAASLPQLPDFKRSNDPDIKMLKAQLKEIRLALHQKYQHHVKNLNAKKIDRETLMSIYETEMKIIGNDSPSVRYPGTEHGLEQFFRKIMRHTQRSEAINIQPGGNFQTNTAQILSMLFHAA